MKEQKKTDVAPKAVETPKEPIVDETAELIPETEPSGPSDEAVPAPTEEMDLGPGSESDPKLHDDTFERVVLTPEEIAAAEAAHKVTMR